LGRRGKVSKPLKPLVPTIRGRVYEAFGNMKVGESVDFFDFAEKLDVNAMTLFNSAKALSRDGYLSLRVAKTFLIPHDVIEKMRYRKRGYTFKRKKRFRIL